MTLKDVRAWFGDPTVSKWRKALLAGALIYAVIPFDIVPDAIPIFGWLDDLGVMAFALAAMRADVQRHAALRGKSDPSTSSG
jgi:uncharacterized membrane protein YkvA (DUF1232 family)